ncbi:zinc ribbon domain-containing protein [Flavobacterium pectinovorum]|uniref:zinc ribbon domain-containing protein n=1 Tax=Flavobacterium pectinovorum TaxID=29533 RepID=UPI001FAB7FB8|nr:zinc ribbon domain-containing protein [Flavobacterium pectinovorum]MCI9846545.1 zinc-ribbon domain-containing protein [Flavobacterium pectinovorum]
MLFLIGTRDSNIKNGEIFNEKCPKCNEENTLHFSIYRRYTHLTLIPLFPVGKLVFIKCSHCKETFNYEDLSESIQLKLRTEKTGNSIWMFTGSFILALFLIFTIKNYFDKKDETSILIKTPIVGDVYNLKFSDGYYSNMKIDKVTKDSVYTTHNDFNAYLPYEIDALDKSENYTNRKATYSKKELLELYKKDEIIKIKRSKYPIQLLKSEYQIPITK